MELAGQHILIIGMGATGVATASFLGARGARVSVTDEKPSQSRGSAYLTLAGQPWLSEAAYDETALDGMDRVVPSPGIPPHHPILQAACREGIPITGEIELAFRHIRAPILAVTGTNGKTTATTLLGEMLALAGKKVFVGGNIGTPLIEYASGSQEDEFVVAEISSFQLQWIETFRPAAAALLNITCDHMNYHGSFDEYRRVKARIFENMQQSDLAILNADDPAQKGLETDCPARVAFFSSTKAVETGAFLDGSDLVCRLHGASEERYPLSMIRLSGLHNVENVMAALIAARFAGLAPEAIESAVRDFRGLPHRIEFVREKDGVKYYDDSKGTNVDAVVRALATFSKPVVLLLGGRDKDGDFQTLRPRLQKNVRAVVLFGEARERIAELIGDAAPRVVKTQTMREGVERAAEIAAVGDVVLLSPGCASFDEFKDYKHRGDVFQQTVGKL